MPLKTKPKRQLTSKQKKALTIVNEKVRKGEEIKKWEILLQAWYSSNISKQPSRVFDNRAFRDILDAELPAETLAQSHARFMKRLYPSQMQFEMTMPDTIIQEMIEECDYKFKGIAVGGNEKRGFYKIAYFIAPKDELQFKALKEAYKVQGHYDPPVETTTPRVSLIALFNRAAELRKEQELECTQNGAETP